MNAKDACWALHLENVRLRTEIQDLHEANKRLHGNVITLERRLECVSPTITELRRRVSDLRKQLYKAQIRALVRS